MLSLHCKEAVTRQKHTYAKKGWEIQTMNINKLSCYSRFSSFIVKWNRIASQWNYTLSKGQSSILTLPYAFCHRIKKPSVKAMLLKLTLFAYKSRTPNTETVSDIGWVYTKPVTRNRNKLSLFGPYHISASFLQQLSQPPSNNWSFLVVLIIIHYNGK